VLAELSGAEEALRESATLCGTIVWKTSGWCAAPTPVLRKLGWLEDEDRQALREVLDAILREEREVPNPACPGSSLATRLRPSRSSPSLKLVEKPP